MKNTVLLFLNFVSSVVSFEYTSQRATDRYSDNNRKYKATWKSLDSRPTPTWYDEAKFGIFVHWGVYSVPAYGTEWVWKYWKYEHRQDIAEFMKKHYPGLKYADFASMFTAKFFDAAKWADIINKSRAKYFVFTSKHHDGFTNWPSKESWNWNSVDIGPHKDIVCDLAKAIRSRTDMKFCLYYSLYEWFNPTYLEEKKSKFATDLFVREKVIPQLFDLVTRYKPQYIWADGDWEANSTYWSSRQFLAWLYNESPVKDTVVVNDRWGIDANCNHGDVKLCEDRYLPDELKPFKWENAMTIDKESWGYRKNASLTDYYSIAELIEILAKTVSHGGNLLMNIAPNSDGIIPTIYEERLQQIGEWLDVNGEAIFSTKPWRFQADSIGSKVWFTSKDDKVYAIVCKWPVDSRLKLNYPQTNQGTEVTMLGIKRPRNLSWTELNENKGIIIDLRGIGFSELPSPWAWTFVLQNLSNEGN